MKFKNRPLLAAPAALLAAGILAVAATGCGGNDTSSASGGNASDLAFVADMIPHHQGAIDMAEIALKRAEHPQIRTLASGIIAAQKAEIATMQAMQSDLEHMGMHDGHMGMSQAEMGMDGDMPMLESAKPFDKAFIDMMIPHHQGAIRMARTQLSAGRMPALHNMASGIVKAQSAEIARMREWRKQWYGDSQGSATGGAAGMGSMGMSGSPSGHSAQSTMSNVSSTTMNMSGDGSGLSDHQGTVAVTLKMFPAKAHEAGRVAVLITSGTSMRPLGSYDVKHTRRMHLIVVSRDLRSYRHLHPRMASAGVWSVPFTASQPGGYRVYADFASRGRSYVLATDANASGTASPYTLPAPDMMAHTDGYMVTLETRGGQDIYQVTRGDRTVKLSPYLGAPAHLVAIHQGDLAYEHVHPDGGDMSRGVLRFMTYAPTSGKSREFLQFRAGGKVHTATFTVAAAGTMQMSG